MSNQNVKVARFARNVECNFLGDFQTLWSLTAFLRLIMRPLFLISSSQGSEKIEVFVWYYSMLYLCSLFFFPQFLDLFFPEALGFLLFSITCNVPCLDHPKFICKQWGFGNDPRETTFHTRPSYSSPTLTARKAHVSERENTSKWENKVKIPFYMVWQKFIKNAKNGQFGVFLENLKLVVK